MFATDRPTWQNPKILSTLLLVFIAGALTGAASMRFGLHDRWLHPVASMNRPDQARAFLARCQKELNLSPEQTDQISSILDDYKKYYESLQEQIEDIRATGKIRIMNVLHEDQKAKFEKLLEPRQ